MKTAGGICHLWANYDMMMKKCSYGTGGADMTDREQAAAAAKFAQQWAGRGYEKGESQTFWLTLLTDVFGVEDVGSFITFEEQVKLDHASFIDGYIPSTHVLIEQKGLGKDLNKPIKQSDGSLLTPFQQEPSSSPSCPGRVPADRR